MVLNRMETEWKLNEKKKWKNKECFLNKFNFIVKMCCFNPILDNSWLKTYLIIDSLFIFANKRTLEVILLEILLKVRNILKIHFTFVQSLWLILFASFFFFLFLQQKWGRTLKKKKKNYFPWQNERKIKQNKTKKQ